MVFNPIFMNIAKFLCAFGIVFNPLAQSFSVLYVIFILVFPDAE